MNAMVLQQRKNVIVFAEAPPMEGEVSNPVVQTNSC